MNRQRQAGTIAEAPRFIVITGLSGAGKSHAIRALEDLGYFCIDNLPPALIPTFAELSCAGQASSPGRRRRRHPGRAGISLAFPDMFRKLARSRI